MFRTQVLFQRRLLPKLPRAFGARKRLFLTMHCAHVLLQLGPDSKLLRAVLARMRTHLLVNGLLVPVQVSHLPKRTGTAVAAVQPLPAMDRSLVRRQGAALPEGLVTLLTPEGSLEEMVLRVVADEVGVGGEFLAALFAGAGERRLFGRLGGNVGETGARLVVVRLSRLRNWG
eukprot:Plantae.Rhodophyta-Rhodochaete_pulchella.ctg66230.p2 GENE.Plantae.Rhodophyta-Rhodochaete_pulchella.ctg66230~~Plantae.Rhodophyta-Rhodochaete_pulchella.ctg66230.p2  ORF type:complete len:173 (-),score=10.76 Plantae.Rhodophyta-Rhodochaete_pulchella.ctg66230:213-731(-)